LGFPPRSAVDNTARILSSFSQRESEQFTNLAIQYILSIFYILK